MCGRTHLETEKSENCTSLSEQRLPQVSALPFSLRQVPLILEPFPLAVLQLELDQEAEWSVEVGTPGAEQQQR